MKLVRCNKCNHEYYICETADYKGYTISQPQCQQCGVTDYTVLDNDVKVKYNTEYECDLEIENADLKHSLLLFKEELDELIKTYIEPFLK